MPLLPMDKAIRRRRAIRINVFIGVLVFCFGFYKIATGDFSSYHEAKSSASFYNLLTIGGALYAAFSWMYCMLSKPFWFPKFQNKDK